MSVSTVGHRLALAALASCFAGSLSTGAAHALTSATDQDQARQRDVVMREFDPAEFSAQAEKLPTGLVKAIGRDLDITAEQYLARAAAAKVAGEVVASLRDVISAAWLDGQALHVAVQDKSAEAKVAATGATVHVGDSLTDALAAARSQGQVVYADRQRDQLVPVESDIIAQPAQTSRPASEPEPRDQDKLLGGYRYLTADSLFEYQCTAAFNGTNGDDRPTSLTAGHCAQQESGTTSGPIDLLGLALPDHAEGDAAEEDEPGLVESLLPDDLTGEEEEEETGAGEFAEDSTRFGDGHDAALLEITEDRWQLRPEIAAMAGANKQGRGLPIYDSIDAVVGAPLCTLGGASGWTCGKLLDTESTIPVSGVKVSGFMHDACTLPGDGGGPIVVGHYALGVNSGSTWSTSDCGDVETKEAAPVAVGYAVSGGKRNAAALYKDHWDLSIWVGTPEIIAPVEGDVTGMKPTIRGRIDAAAGATVVVEVDGTESVEAEVQPDGRWSAPITKALPSGQHNYTVTAFHTPAAGNEPTTSDTVTETFEVAEVATLSVRNPTDNETTTISAPRFVGTGDPGARITLQFDGETTATAVEDDGTWTVSPPETPRAGRFNATVTQDTGDTTDSVTVKRIGVVPGAPLVNPPDGEVTSGYVVTGTAIPSSTIALRVEPAQNTSTENSPAQASEHVAVTDDDGTWAIGLDNLSPGLLSVSAVQAVDDLTSERSAAVALEVTDIAAGATRAPADDDIVHTGSSAGPLIVAGLALLALGTVGALVARRRHRGSAA